MNKPPDWDGLGAAVEAEDRHRRTVVARSRYGSRGRWYAAASVCAVLLLCAGMFGPWSPSPPGPGATQLQRGRTLSLRMATQALHDYAAMHGRYPDRLEEAIELDIGEDIEYRVTQKGFQLMLTDARRQQAPSQGSSGPGSDPAGGFNPRGGSQ